MNAQELPKALLPFPNQDKVFHETWHPGRDLGNFPHPYRAILAGPPNSGKSTCIKNIMCRANPPFEQIVLISPDPNFSKEYTGIKLVSLTKCPPPEEFPGDKKMLVVMDDLEYSSMSKKELGNISRLFGYVSTHKNVTVLMSAQDPISVPKCARRLANLFIFSKAPDVGAMAAIAKKVCLTPKRLMDLLSFCQKPYDALWLDYTKDSPAPVRLNCYDVIESKFKQECNNFY